MSTTNGMNFTIRCPTAGSMAGHGELKFNATVIVWLYWGTLSRYICSVCTAWSPRQALAHFSDFWLTYIYASLMFFSPAMSFLLYKPTTFTIHSFHWQLIYLASFSYKYLGECVCERECVCVRESVWGWEGMCVWGCVCVCVCVCGSWTKIICLHHFILNLSLHFVPIFMHVVNILLLPISTTMTMCVGWECVWERKDMCVRVCVCVVHVLR